MALPDTPHAHDHAIRQRTAKLLEDRDSTLAGLLATRDPRGAMTTVEVRAIVVRLRALMMDATFDDTHNDADISETSELYEWWRQHLAQVD